MCSSQVMFLMFIAIRSVISIVIESYVSARCLLSSKLLFLMITVITTYVSDLYCHHKLCLHVQTFENFLFVMLNQYVWVVYKLFTVIRRSFQGGSLEGVDLFVGQVSVYAPVGQSKIIIFPFNSSSKALKSLLKCRFSTEIRYWRPDVRECNRNTKIRMQKH